VRACSNYGDDIPAIVSKDNFYGVQFHPERSGSVGLSILRNFCAL
jgi:glutamine amidotransferase